jgi:acyl-CoA reductase-like NAD-dependent aldehyde dehydrogenase
MEKRRNFIIGGKERLTQELLDVRFPYSGELVARVSLAGDQDLEDAVLAARNGFELTRKLSSFQRSNILYKLLDLMEKRTDELVNTLILEGGKARSVAQAEVARARETIRISAEEAKRIGGEIVPIDSAEGGQGRMGITRRFPLGVVLAISPFNYPLNLACHKLGPAIAAGNSFILKPASSTPLSGLLLGEMILEAGT